jgi:hypothetical protein
VRRDVENPAPAAVNTAASCALMVGWRLMQDTLLPPNQRVVPADLVACTWHAGCKEGPGSTEQEFFGDRQT